MMSITESSPLDTGRANKREEERRSGVELDIFMALSNLARELIPLNYPRPVEDVWFAYRDHIALTDMYRERPHLFTGYAHVEGLQHLTGRLDAGGVILLLHLGDYRHGPLVVTQEIRKLAKDVPLAMLVDHDSYSSEANLPIWLGFRREYNVEFMIAENPHIGIQIMRHLRRGGWIYVYLDGNTGAGNDASPLELRFLSSRIRLRSGLFRLLARTGSAVVPMVTDRADGIRPRIAMHPAVHVSPGALDQGLEDCFQHFREPLLRQPELWRFWFRHHHQVVRWHPIAEPEAPSAVDWRCNEVVPPLGLSLASGRVFRIS